MWRNMCHSQKFVYMAALILVLGLAADVANADIRSGLVGYYPLDEGMGNIAHDMSGNGHDGTLHNGITWIAQAYQGAGVKSDGTTDTRIQIGTWNPAEERDSFLWPYGSGGPAEAALIKA